MELSKKMKKIWAVLCIVALVVTSVTVYQNTISADILDVSAENGLTIAAVKESWTKAEVNKYPWEDLGSYTYYVGNFGVNNNATASYKGGDQLNNFAFRIDSNVGCKPYLVRLKTKGFATEEGKDYKYVVEFDSNKAGSVLRTSIDENRKLVDYTLVKGSNKIEVDFTANTTSSKIYFEMGAVAAETELEFTKVEVVEKKEINTLVLADITAQTYTGAEIKPQVTINDGDTVLRPTTDYTVTYSDNINVGPAKIVIEGCGSYTGKKETRFDIVAKALDKATVSVNAPSYTGEAISKDDINEIIVDKIKFASSNFDISIDEEAKDKINAGEKVKVTVKSKEENKNFINETKTEVTIVPRNINDDVVSVEDIPDQEYTGEKITPEVIVKHGDKQLVKGTDYSLSYVNNINAGTSAQVTITGKGNYTGTKTLTFTINPQELDDTKITIAPQTYTGEPVLPKEIRYDGKTKISDADFTVELVKKDETEQIDNTNVGKVKVKITGKRNYQFTKEAEFEIVPKSVADLEISEIGVMEYTGAEIKPTLSIKYGKLSLENDKDYTLKYANNTKVGMATVVITGKGNYKDEKKVTFKIQKTIKLTVKEGKKTYVYTLGTEPSYKLPTNNKQLTKQFPKLVKKGRVFKGFYKNGKKITKISNSTEVTLNAKNYRTLKTSVKQMILNKGIISFKFNKKDWKQLDGVEITWAKNSKFKGKSKKKKTILTKGKKIQKLKYVIKKSERYFKSGEYYCFRIRYFYKVKNKKYYYQRESRKSIVYGKRLVVRK